MLGVDPRERGRALPSQIAVPAAGVAALLLLPLLVDAVDGGGGLRWAGLVVAVLAGGTAVVAPSSRGSGRWWLTGAALLVLTGLGVVAAVELGDAWRNAWLLLAIAVGSLSRRGGVSAEVALVGVAATTALASVAGALGGDGSGGVWAVALTVALSGGSTVVLVVLLRTIDELRCTREELARAAVSRERDRMSRDLHDLLGHTLSLVVVKAEAVRRLVDVHPEVAAGHARDLEEIGRRALLEVRESVQGERRTSLVSELARAKGTLEAAGVDAAVSGAPALVPEPVDEALAWVVREGVTNVVRHGVGVRHVEVRVVTADAAARVEVCDDGRRADPSAPPSGGSGLDGLRRRVTEVGGRLEVRSDDDGWRLLAVVPLAVGGA